MGSQSSQSNNSQAECKAQLDAEEKEYILSMKRLVAKTEESVEGDPSSTNILHHFAQTLQEPQLNSFGRIIDTMKRNWSQFDACCQSLQNEGQITAEKYQSLSQLQADYWKLLLRTKAVIALLCKQCEMRQRDTRNLLYQAKQARDRISRSPGSKLTDDESEMIDYCLHNLAGWIDLEKLTPLSRGWEDMTQHLKQERRSWEDIVNDTKQAAKSTAKSALKWCAGIVAVTGLVVCICFAVAAATAATGGAAAAPALAAGASAAKTVTVGGITLLSTHATGLAVGAGIVVAGGVSWIGHGIWLRSTGAWHARQSAKKINDMLRKMLRQSRRIGYSLNDTKIQSSSIQQELQDMDARKPLLVIEQSAKRIDEHLKEFAEQGRKVMKAVDKACKGYM